MATMLIGGGNYAWADYASQRVFQDWGNGDTSVSSLAWMTTSTGGSKGIATQKSEIQYDGVNKVVHTIYNSWAYCPIESVLPTLAYSDSYTVSFFFKAKARGAFQYAIYKKGVTPTSTMLTADQVLFSIECTSAASSTADEDPMNPSINRSATTVSITGQVYYQVVLVVNSTNATYNIYPITTGSTPYTVDTENPIATGTLSKGEMGGLYLNANNSAQTMRFDDILVDFMPNATTVKTLTVTNSTTTNGLNAAGDGKYYEKYTISATDYNDAVMDITATQTADTYSDLSENILSFKGIGTTIVNVNNKSAEVDNTVAYLKAASYDLTNRSYLVTDNDHSLNRNDAYFYGFGVTGNNIERYCWQKGGKNSGADKWILNGFKATATSSNYWQFHPDYGINVTNDEVLASQSAIDDMYINVSYKKNTGEASGDGKDVYAATPTSYSWEKSSSVTFLSRDEKVIYTGLDVYVPAGTTVTPTTINSTYNVGTFSYPYALDFSGLTTMTAWKATEANASTITMEQVTGVVPAGTPLILRGTAEAIPLANEPGTSFTNLLKPVLDNDANKTVSAGGTGTTNYVLTVQDENVVFAPISETSASVPYGRAYLQASGVSLTKSMRFVVDGEASEVVAPEVAEVEEDEVLYNMAGLRVGKDYKGIVINQKGVKLFNK